jgi:hypothetical protein
VTSSVEASAEQASRCCTLRAAPRRAQRRPAEAVPAPMAYFGTSLTVRPGGCPPSELAFSWGFYGGHRCMPEPRPLPQPPAERSARSRVAFGFSSFSNAAQAGTRTSARIAAIEVTCAATQPLPGRPVGQIPRDAELGDFSKWHGPRSDDLQTTDRRRRGHRGWGAGPDQGPVVAARRQEPGEHCGGR